MSQGTKERVVALFFGHVQGVGFRYSVISISRDFDVTGYVKNLKDGRVEMCAEGAPEDVTSFLKAIEQSHLNKYFTDIHTEWCAPTGAFTSFGIKY